MQAKSVSKLEICDIANQPVWQYTNIDSDETSVRPVAKVPVDSLTGKIVATQVRLANGSKVWAIIGNVDCTNPRLTEHFLTISIWNQNKWFTLSRYHDFDYTERGPAALSSFLGLEEDDVFPIEYDIRKLAKGLQNSLIGRVLKEPKEQLTRAEIIALAVP